MNELKDAIRNMDICRFCLNLTVSKINLSTDDFAKMVEILTSIKIKPDDGLSQISCLKCAREVKTAFLIRRRIIQSHRTLTSKINPETLNTLFTPSQQLESIIIETESAEDAESSPELEHCPVEVKLEEPTSSNNNFSLAIINEGMNEKIQKLKLSLNNKYLNKQKTLLSIKRRNILKVPVGPKPKKPEPPKLYCQTCQIKFASRMKYNNHMSKHRNKACPVCAKQVRSAYLKKHMLVHIEAPVICEVCGVTCKNSISLRMHFVYYHNSAQIICEDCGKSFKTKTKLMYHQRKDHIKERNHKCETCGKCFFEKIYLTKHINMKHMKLRPHICEYCGKGFSGKHALRTHIRQHTKEAPYQCTFCKEGFRQRVSLRAHLRSRHNVQEKNDKFCDVCGKGFATAMALDVHARLHAEIKCPHCPDTFADETYLGFHLSSKHPEVDLSETLVNWEEFGS
ncbi:unnamed protein product [Ceutorhynchus assimilis]|uniref:Uncharacterized protein n=1 Tax=Ceutorhynchus assimilis TaxID=467358 RepID=A0A9N9QE62_9CUCU|nr:unnamed protein product [Ceutorhynchus assimilis]